MTIRKHTAKSGSTSYGVRINRGAGGREWVGTYPTRKLAQAAERDALANGGQDLVHSLTCADWAARFLARYAA